MGEDIDVVLEKGKVLHIKTLTPGIEVGNLHHGVLDSSICVFDAWIQQQLSIPSSNYLNILLSCRS